MCRRTTVLVAAALIAGALAAPARADTNALVLLPGENLFPWTFEGPLGRFDQAQLRRGFQVFMEGCAACHSLRHVAYQDLSALGVGFGPEDIKALAAEFKVPDGPDENGKMFLRPAKPADTFALPYPNKEAARVANKGMYPPDLSLITRARRGGHDFLYDFLTQYGPPPADFELGLGMTYNTAVSGRQTGMKAVLVDGFVDYEDGTPATADQMARDVTAFLAWAADPHMATRKALGLKVVIFLILLTTLFIALKMEVWAGLNRRLPPERPGDGAAGGGSPARTGTTASPRVPAR
jgi:ubiquinol-cytochrome c reductase cytochrome c1 subunit